MEHASLPASAELLAALERWVDAGALRALDLALTRFIADDGDETDPAVLLALALTSERNGHGHVCLDLAGALQDPRRLLAHLRDDEPLNPTVRAELSGWLAALTLPDWTARLAASPAVSARLAGASAPPSDEAPAPFVLAGTAAQPLLYLRRYWRYEQQIRDGIEQRLAAPIAVDEPALRDQLDALFAPSATADGPPDWQRIACGLAARHPFFIITGGPGTGKTTTVVRLLAVLQGLATQTRTDPPRIELAAPTGKAAARLTESIRSEAQELPPAVQTRGGIPSQVKTLHRLLESVPDSRHFRHHAANPLPADVVVVDEASMVDVEMMAHLMDALRPDARLVLIGDKDQLSSVEAGAVLGDLCQRAERGHYRPETADWVRHATGHRLPPELTDEAGGRLDQAIVMLRQSYRFSDAGGIGALAKAVNRDDAAPRAASAQPPATRPQRVLALFDQEQDQTLGVICRRPIADANDPAFAELILAAYRSRASFLGKIKDQAPEHDADQHVIDGWAAEVLQAQKAFQLLTPLRQGPWGVEGLNQHIIDLLKAHALLPHAGGAQAPAGAAAGAPASLSPRQWFAGRPVLITRNDYGLDLMNGDIGVTLSVPDRDPSANGRRLRVAFPSPEGGVRWVLPSRLQHVETVFAMTVHKSQGSEFTHTALVLPETSNPVLTRELVYTAITRARERFTLLDGSEAVLAEALRQRVQRVSGLRDLAADR
jgi:exodeoxyribonuclease V alpha subunit